MTKATNELDKLFTCYEDRTRQSYNSYRKAGMLLRSQGYDPGKLNDFFETVMSRVIAAWEKYYADHCPCAEVENVTKSSAEAVAVAPVKPAKRDYPVIISYSLIESYVSSALSMGECSVRMINAFFDAQTTEERSLKFCWSQAR